jgi:chorismate mutase
MDARPPSPSLSDLRSELAHVDRELVGLLARRLRVARTAIRMRVASGEPVTDRVQERRVRDRAQRWALELGVAPELVDRLFRDLIQTGKDGAHRPAARGFSSLGLRRAGAPEVARPAGAGESAVPS